MTVIGSYPCCDGPLLIQESPLPGYTIVFAYCEHCDAKVVHRLSMVDPVTWLADDFPNWDSVRNQNGDLVSRDDVEWVRLVKIGFDDEAVR